MICVRKTEVVVSDTLPGINYYKNAFVAVGGLINYRYLKLLKPHNRQQERNGKDTRKKRKP